MNYYERHIGDYLKDTAHLSLLEHGIYSRLLDVYYTKETGIPSDEVARLVGARSKEEKQALQVVLAEFFKLCEGIYKQARCDREIERYQAKQEKARSSANARWKNDSQHTERNAKAMRTHSEGSAPNHQTPDTSNTTTTVVVGSAKRRTQIPADFEPNETGRQTAVNKGIQVHTELVKFIDFHTAKGSVMLDWQAAWRTWVGNARPQPQQANGETAYQRAQREKMQLWAPGVAAKVPNFSNPITLEDVSNVAAIEGR